MNNTKDYISIKFKNIKISISKLNIYILKIYKKTYNEIKNIIKFFPKKIYINIFKLYNLIIYNIINKYNIKKENLIIINICLNKGNILKKMQPAAKGKSYIIKKRISYIIIKICNIYEYITLNFINLILI